VDDRGLTRMYESLCGDTNTSTVVPIGCNSVVSDQTCVSLGRWNAWQDLLTEMDCIKKHIAKLAVSGLVLTIHEWRVFGLGREGPKC
jgi:hypothetical protein